MRQSAADPSTIQHLLASAEDALTGDLGLLGDVEFGAPSLLPGWSRAHLVAHLTLNAESLAAVLRGVATGAVVPMYPSQEARDGDIAELAPQPPAVQLPRLRAAQDDFARALSQHDPADDDVTTERTPGSGAVVRAGDVGGRRLFEVVLHRIDLGLGSGPDDIPSAVAELLLASLARNRGAGLRAVLRATDLGVDHRPGGEGDGSRDDVDPPVVSGTAAALAWWLAGRGPTDPVTGRIAVTTDRGDLPQMGAW